MSPKWQQWAPVVAIIGRVRNSGPVRRIRLAARCGSFLDWFSQLYLAWVRPELWRDFLGAFAGIRDSEHGNHHQFDQRHRGNPAGGVAQAPGHGLPRSSRGAQPAVIVQSSGRRPGHAPQQDRSGQFRAGDAHRCRSAPHGSLWRPDSDSGGVLSKADSAGCRHSTACLGGVHDLSCCRSSLCRA